LQNCSADGLINSGNNRWPLTEICPRKEDRLNHDQVCVITVHLHAALCIRERCDVDKAIATDLLFQANPVLYLFVHCMHTQQEDAPYCHRRDTKLTTPCATYHPSLLKILQSRLYQNCQEHRLFVAIVVFAFLIGVEDVRKCTLVVERGYSYGLLTQHIMDHGLHVCFKRIAKIGKWNSVYIFPHVVVIDVICDRC